MRRSALSGDRADVHGPLGSLSEQVQQGRRVERQGAEFVKRVPVEPNLLGVGPFTYALNLGGENAAKEELDLVEVLGQQGAWVLRRQTLPDEEQRTNADLRPELLADLAPERLMQVLSVQLAPAWERVPGTFAGHVANHEKATAPFDHRAGGCADSGHVVDSAVSWPWPQLRCRLCGDRQVRWL